MLRLNQLQAELAESAVAGLARSVWAAGRAYANDWRRIAGVVGSNVLVGMCQCTVCQIGHQSAIADAGALRGAASDVDLAVVGRHVLHCDSVCASGCVGDHSVTTADRQSLRAGAKDADITHIACAILEGQGSIAAIRA